MFSILFNLVHVKIFQTEKRCTSFFFFFNRGAIEFEHHYDLCFLAFSRSNQPEERVPSKGNSLPLSSFVSPSPCLPQTASTVAPTSEKLGGFPEPSVPTSHF